MPAPTPGPEVDDVDRAIVAALVADGRTSFTDLGRQVGLPTSTVHQRVRRLEQRGVVKGYTAVVDHEALGLPLSAIVSVTPFDPAAPDDVPERLARVAEVESCWSVAGEESYVLLVRTQTPGRLEEVLAEIRTVGSVATRTTVILSTPFEGRRHAREMPAGEPG
ncbi:Lrp/AsnC family transcriptional regulator [Pseudokineococcus sp. 1T1Z-3]|uniref:Lrp/AsnC family transcriptional regulator n=1 Tax=Pseudokineococcus sp. 1T1Z-3 TaxID=3132745 RepID=UPI0030B737AE